MRRGLNPRRGCGKIRRMRQCADVELNLKVGQIAKINLNYLDLNMDNNAKVQHAVAAKSHLKRVRD